MTRGSQNPHGAGRIRLEDETMTTTKEKRADMIQQFVAAAQEAHRTHDVVRRRQCEENIRQLTSRAQATAIIASMYGAK